jgi:hypothetical protein
MEIYEGIVNFEHHQPAKLMVKRSSLSHLAPALLPGRCHAMMSTMHE